jgi:hypothetical protein
MITINNFQNKFRFASEGGVSRERIEDKIQGLKGRLDQYRIHQDLLNPEALRIQTEITNLEAQLTQVESQEITDRRKSQALGVLKQLVKF